MKKCLSATLWALAFFICLNAIPLVIKFLANNNVAAPGNDISINKLHQEVMNSSYESVQSGPWPWWVARAYFSTPSPDIVVLGDSQMNAAFIQADAMTTNKPKDCTVDRSCISLKEALQKHLPGRRVQAVNLALGGAMPSDYYLMSRAFFNKNIHPKIVVIGISPRSYIDTTLESASATETFQFLAPNIDLGSLADRAFPNVIEEYFWLIRNKYTLFSYQQDVAMTVHAYVTKHFPSANTVDNFSKNSKQALASIYSGSGYIPIGTNIVGPNASIPFRENMAEYKRRFAHLNPKTLEDQSAYFQATLNYLKSIGVSIIVVEMPMLKPVRDLLPSTSWQKYHSSLADVCKANGANLIDLSDSKDFPQSEFIDYVHLNATGGKHFIEQLACYIK